MRLTCQELGLPAAKVVGAEQAVGRQVHQCRAADPPQVAVHPVIQNVHGLPQELLEAGESLDPQRRSNQDNKSHMSGESTPPGND